ncbi:dopamine D2-like receptor [Melanotaenia boesemani]|uniref:dopamine D2-like receptor n=1 Tax=Melanotaenia boesemani TaxID=1250792 RepID=UPI001C05AA91|nr:dopamine D2-like receptor [Melanotaenia boesemani]
MTDKPTPAWDFGNITIWEEYINATLVVANSLVLSITSVVGVASNIFVILAVYHQKSLQTSVNALVVNLAVIDSLRCIIDCPILLTIIMTVQQRGHADSLICEAQMASFSFSCCVQLLTLACISAERYQAIAQPFKISQRKRRIMILIPLTWTLAIVMAVFCLIFLKDSPVYVRCQGMQAGTTSYDTIGFYMLLPLWAICLAVITGFYASIFALLRSHNRKIFDEGTSLPKKVLTKDKEKREDVTVVEHGHGKTEQEQVLSISIAEPNPFKKNAMLTSEEASQSVSISSENKEEFKNTKMSHLETEPPNSFAVHVAVQALEETSKMEKCSPCSIKTEVKALKQSTTANDESLNTVMQKVLSNSNTDKQSEEGLKTGKAAIETSPLVVLSAQLEGPQSTSVLPTDLKPAQNSNREETQTVATQDQVSSPPPATGNNVELEGAVCMMPSKASKERARKKKESKMAKRAGYIIITFLLFWLPLITSILVDVLVHKNKNTQISIIQDLEILTVSIACITSLSDPIIYAAINPQFRSEFYKLRSWIKSRFSRN